MQHCTSNLVLKNDKTSLDIQRYIEGDFDVTTVNRLKISVISQIKMKGSE